MRKIVSLALAACLTWAAAVLAAQPSEMDGLIRELRALKPDRRAHAALSLGQLGPLAAPAVRSLVSALADPSVGVQLEALIALEHIGPAARAAVPDLVHVLEAHDARLYAGAIDALGSIGPDALEAAPALMHFVRGSDELLATSAALALTRIL